MSFYISFFRTYADDEDYELLGVYTDMDTLSKDIEKKIGGIVNKTMLVEVNDEEQMETAIGTYLGDNDVRLAMTNVI